MTAAERTRFDELRRENDELRRENQLSHARVATLERAVADIPRKNRELQDQLDEVSDCLAAYEDLPYRMHKCIAHHQKAIARVRERPDTIDPSHLDDWKRLFTMVNALWRHRDRLGEPEFARRREHLELWLDRLLGADRTQPGDVAIQRRIGRRRHVVLGCLDDPAAEPTNNRAERSLRPAVIARKLSCGNRTESGKLAWERLTSLATTCRQRGVDFASWLASCLPLDAAVSPIPLPR